VRGKGLFLVAFWDVRKHLVRKFDFLGVVLMLLLLLLLLLLLIVRV